MNDFLKKVIVGIGVSPSTICLDAFTQNFKDTINVEWFDKKTYYEAIFYKEKLEHIAIFDLAGGLIEYKINLPTDYLPEPLRKTAEARGEIMNVLMRNKGNMLEYEVIVRDKEFHRFLINLSDTGNLLEERNL